MGEAVECADQEIRVFVMQRISKCENLQTSIPVERSARRHHDLMKLAACSRHQLVV